MVRIELEPDAISLFGGDVVGLPEHSEDLEFCESIVGGNLPFNNTRWHRATFGHFVHLTHRQHRCRGRLFQLPLFDQGRLCGLDQKSYQPEEPGTPVLHVSIISSGNYAFRRSEIA